MIPYYEALTEEERERVSAAVKILLSQTFVLEHKFDRKTGRMGVNPLFRTCDLHLEFLKDYFLIAGLEVREDARNGIIYLSGGNSQVGPRISEYATKCILILKVIYDEQMSSTSAADYVVSCRSEIQEKMAEFHLLDRQPGPSEVRLAIRLLKRYQLIDFLENTDETDLNARFVIYPSINMVLLGEDIRSLLEEYQPEEETAHAAEI